MPFSTARSTAKGRIFGSTVYPKVRDGGRIVVVVEIITVMVTTEGRREIVGLGTGPSEAERFWAAFQKALVKRGLKGGKLVIPDAHGVGTTRSAASIHDGRDCQVLEGVAPPEILYGV